MAGPHLTDAGVRFEYADPEHTLNAVSLYQEVTEPRERPMQPVEGGWEVTLPLPPVQRLEYMLVLDGEGDYTDWVTDPDNPLQADGPFGPKSVLELPGYAPPAWLEDAQEPAGSFTPLQVKSTNMRRTYDVTVWTAPGSTPDDELPLLLVHDGTEYAQYSELLTFFEHHARSGMIPPMHAALIQPARRTYEFAANAGYDRALRDEIIPAIEQAVRVPAEQRARAGMGASLGGLAMMHAHRMYPHILGGLFLQSSSFFRRPLDEHGEWFPGYGRIIRFVDGLAGSTVKSHDAIPVMMTCGIGEPNIAGNRAIRDALATQGYPVQLAEMPDGHNWTAWRDALAPHLVNLLQQLWG